MFSITEEGVFVDGVAMIGVANDERIDAMKFRDEEFKDAERVHRSQRVSGMRTEQNFAQAVPEKWPLGHVDGEDWERFGDTVLGILRERVAVRGDHRERP